ncbi:Sensor histidine kinase TodS [Mariniflexile rhizosphaerae]|uniref:two-component regulator propeller domain-containing protein n=1 Tax=unclassified Mariniflexile TaxID=2643887 RepID=UPI000E32EA19|nr:two-component regulator propeller domain-containing protein [Mariniflexile sp. TRM1-10]AXP82064.1 Sensor histidine kinase TodS [Mariniflexile sp. TRM1-10]
MKLIKNHLLYIFILTNTFCYSQGSNFNNLIAQRSTLKFEHFNVQSGLSNNFITDLAKDSLGYIWVSTFDGLNRYNGDEFFSFKKENDSNNSLNYNFIQQAKFNKKGELLIATGEGLNIYNPQTDSFTLIDETNGLIRESLSCLEFGKQNELVLGVYGRGVQFYNPDKPKQTTLLKHEPTNEKSVSSNNISCILLEEESTLWVGTFNDGLNKINYYTKEVERIAIGNKSNEGLHQINCLFLDSEGNLWIGTRDGIVIFTKDNEKIYMTSSKDENNGLSDKEVLSFEQDYLGNVWVGTQNGGLNIINLNSYRNHKKFIKWYLPNHNGNDFQGRGVSTIMRDQDDHMWIGTNYGLYYVNPKDEPIKHFKEKFTDAPISINCNYIRSITERYNGEIWIGTDGAGVNLYNPNTGRYKYFVHDENNPSSLSNNYVYDILEDSKKRVWIGTYRGGLNLLNPATGHTKKYLQGSIENGFKVNVIYEDNLKNIWVGTNRGGLYKYNETLDAFIYMSTLGKIDVRDITEDEFGNIWMATYGNGVVKYNPNSGVSDIFMMGNTIGITSNIMYAIVKLTNKSFLVGSAYGGMFKLYPDDRRVISYTVKEGLSNNTINSMVSRSKDEIWLGTFNGISYFNTTTETITNLNSFDNIYQSDFNVGAAFKSKDGILYFGSNNGLYIINPDKIFASAIDYPLIFESLEVFNNKVNVTPDQSKSILKQSLPYVKHIALDHNQTLITIDFSILKYPNAQNIKYSYLLEGYQDQWVNINNSNSINLSKLPPGDYNLIVKGVINPEKTVSNNLFITINPPFWKTLPAYLLYLIILSFLIWIGAKYYSERIKLKNSLVFEKKQRQLENELNFERARFFTSFSHELKTPLSLIIAPVENLIEKIDKKKQKEQLNLVLKNSKYLLKNIQKLLEFRKTEIGLDKLSIDNVNISDHINQILTSYKSLAKSRGINLKLHKPESDIYTWCDIEKIEIIIHNLLSNAFKYSKRKGTISVDIKTNNDHVLISVADDGEGVPEHDLPYIFDWYYQSNITNRKKGSGIGLALSKKFAELHMGSLYVESKHKEGTKFTLDIPKDAFNEKTINSNYTPIIENEDQKEFNSTAEIWEVQEELFEKELIRSKIKQDKSRNLILIVDDNKDLLLFLSSLLEDEYDLIFAENGTDGINKAIKYVPDLILSDVMMPIENGIDLCKILKKEQTTSHIPIILLTAAGNTEKINEGYQEGADDYITKPFNPKILKTRIQNLIQNRLKLQDYFSNSITENPEFILENKSLLDNEKTFLQKFNQIIDKHITEKDTNIEGICKEIGMSKTSLYRKMKVLTGKNINELIRKARLEKAVKLIKYENLTISEASYEVGFNSVKYFRKLFKEEYGVLPSKLSEKN